MGGGPSAGSFQGKRLLAAYNNDGPGFPPTCWIPPPTGGWRIGSTLISRNPPLWGVLLVHAEDYDVIDSTSHAAMQHEALSWQVMGTGLCIWASAPSWGRCPTTWQEWLDSVSGGPGSLLRRPLYNILSMGGRAKPSRICARAGSPAGRLCGRSMPEPTKEKKQILTEVFGRLAIDV